MDVLFAMGTRLNPSLTLLNFDVRFTPETGHRAADFACLLWAKIDVGPQSNWARQFSLIKDFPIIRCCQKQRDGCVMKVMLWIGKAQLFERYIPPQSSRR